MAHARMFLVLPLAVLAASCATASRRPTDPPAVLSGNADLAAVVKSLEDYCRSAEGREVRFRVREFASLPGPTIFLAGGYWHASGPLRSVVLVSRDGGRTWQETGPAFAVSEAWNLRTFGRSNVWAIATFTQEGCSTPEVLLASDDAGRTWSTTRLGGLSQGQPLCWVSRFGFDDAAHGVLSVSGSMGKVYTYATEDGGRTWKRLWVARAPLGIIYSYDAMPPPALASLSAPLWEGQGDECRLVGDVRFRKERNWLVIESRDDSADAVWTERSRIPVHYVVRDGRLVPRPDTR